jgi:hypothetical protein
MKSLVIPILVALLGLSAAPALAADVFTVNVPYQFAALDPSITSVGIFCQVRGYEPVTNKFMTFAPVKNTSVPIVKGAASGQVTLVFKTEDFSAQQQAILGAVTDAQCHFSLVTSTGSYFPYGNETQPVLAHKAGTTLSTYSTGTFPK